MDIQLRIKIIKMYFLKNTLTLARRRHRHPLSYGIAIAITLDLSLRTLDNNYLSKNTNT